MKTSHLVGLTVVCALILLVSSLTWVQFRMQINMPAMPGVETAQMQQLPQQMLQVNAWNGHVTFLGAQLPNWFVMLATLSVLLMAWLRAGGAWDAPPVLGILCSIFCLVHLGIIFVVVIANPEQTRFGIGLPLTLALSVAMLVLSILARKGDDSGYRAGYDGFASDGSPP